MIGARGVVEGTGVDRLSVSGGNSALSTPADLASSASPSGRPAVRAVSPDADGVARIVLDRADDRANAIDGRMVEDLAAAVAQVRGWAPRGVVVMSAKDGHFVAGADLTLATRATSADLEAASRALQAALDELASLPCTSVAAINGSALGGGFEIALACDRRVAADSPAVKVGLPEVRLGLVPAAGGTQRLARLVGLPPALGLILGARQLSARRARRAGLVDEVVHPAVLERAAVDLAIRARHQADGRGDRAARAAPSLGDRALTWVPPLRALALWQARSRVRAETKGHYPAPLRAIEAIGIGLAHGTAAGLGAESRAFGELGAGPIARSLVSLLLLTLRQRTAALAGLPPARPVRNLGVVGLGFMGSGIAQAGAVGGMRVRGRDTDAAAVARGLSGVRTLTGEAVRKGVFERREGTRILGRVSGGSDLSGFALADLVVEAVFEDLALKRGVVAELEGVLRDDAVIASNTSALPIAEIASRARVPERIVGMHFFSPVHRMQLIEVVRPVRADAQAVATAVGAARAMGKTPIVVGDGPGFYTTRVIGTMIAEAFALVAEGVGIEHVDRAMTAFGWPVGPLTLVDEVGLEVAAHAGETVARVRGLEAPSLASRLVAEGHQGKRNGRGFYSYERGRRRPNRRVYQLLGVTPRAPSEDVAERLTLSFVNEAARCLDEGILRSAAEGDLGAVLGLGFPPFLGGPFRYADARGDDLVRALERLAEAHGERFAPAQALRSRRPFHRT